MRVKLPNDTKDSFGIIGITLQDSTVALILRHRNVLLHDALDTVQTTLQSVHLRAVAQAHKVVTRGIEKVAPFCRIEVEEYSGD